MKATRLIKTLCLPDQKHKKYLTPRPDNSAKDNSADLKFRQFSQKYADNSARDNSANNSDRRSRELANRGPDSIQNLEPVIAAKRRRAPSAPTGDLKPRNSSNSDFFSNLFFFGKLAELSQAELSVYFWLNCLRAI